MSNKVDAIRYSGFFKTFEYYPVGHDWEGELFNYFIKGYHPGSFHMAMFSNDLLRATQSSHISNQWTVIIQFMKWLNEYAPYGSCGHNDHVQHWLELSTEQRRNICENKGWILSEQEVTWRLMNEQ